MYIDADNQFSDDQAITASAASTNVIDLGADSARIAEIVEKGMSEIFINISEAFNNLTNLKFELQTDDDEAFGSPKVLQEQTVLLADLVLNKKIPFRLPEGAERYIRLNYTVTGTAPTTGKVFAALVLDKHTNF